jgi:hypothetical protein
MATPDEVLTLRRRFGYNNVLHTLTTADLKDLVPGQYMAGIAIDDDDGGEGLYSRVANRFGFIPPTDEYEYGPQIQGARACNHSDGLYGVDQSQCIGRTVAGRAPTMRRKIVAGYTAAKDKCCVGLTDGIKTCDPNYSGPAASGCGDVYRNICGTNPLDPRCATWGGTSAPNKAMYRQFLTDYCGRNIGSTECQQAILREDISVDSQYSLYCDSHPSLPFCACKLPSKLSDPKYAEDVISQTPSCYNGQCIAAGYKTAGQKNQKCPTSITACVNQIDARSGSKVSDVNMSCVQGATGLPSKAGTPPAGAKAAPTTGTDASATTMSPAVMAAIALFILVILVAVYVRFMSSTAFSSLPRSQSALA